MRTSSTRSLILAAALLPAPLLAACGSSSSSSKATTSTSSATTTKAASSAKVSANTASASQIQAALTQAGVSNADRWTREVMEYRPYDATDTNLSSLRKNLAKYNPGDAVVNKIVSVLKP